MAEPAVARPFPAASNNQRPSNKATSKEAHDRLQTRQSRDLVIALCGPIGCGIQTVEEQLKRTLEDEGYEIFSIRLSQLIESFYRDNLRKPLSFNPRDKANRINALMNAGNELRKERGASFCADLAIAHISSLRQEALSGSTESTQETVQESTPTGSAQDPNAREKMLPEKAHASQYKRAYIINQLKHPEEVTALSNIYGRLFYLVGILSDKKHREVFLEKSEGISKQDVALLISRDEQEGDGHGQHLEETIFKADFFINNSDPNALKIRRQFDRFLKLIHGGFGVTPTREEYGMFAAYSASLQSACLSRQVGASILDSEGNLLAIGRNDVPKYGGGLYTEDDNLGTNSKDFRCVHRDQQCHNDLHKNKLKSKIADIIAKEIHEFAERNSVDLSKFDSDALAHKTVKETPIKSLIEYSRAIHAEMDAIISLVRKGKVIQRGSTLFTTTFPCHNCARHIVAAGIDRIIFIEPYEKSLALTLHDDSMEIGNTPEKVHLTPFEGVAPSRYQAFFSNTSPSKADGKMITTDKNDRLQVDREFVDSYIEREIRIAAAVLGQSAD